MNYYAVLDTNVLVSALLARHLDSSPVLILQQMLAGIITPVYDDGILAEYGEVLHRPKFNFSESHISTLLSAILQFGVSVERLQTDATLLDPKDLVFYEVVMAKREDNAYLVTGNIKHFPKEPFIVTPNEMLDILSRDGD